MRKFEARREGQQVIKQNGEVAMNFELQGIVIAKNRQLQPNEEKTAERFGILVQDRIDKEHPEHWISFWSNMEVAFNRALSAKVGDFVLIRGSLGGFDGTLLNGVYCENLGHSSLPLAARAAAAEQTVAGEVEEVSLATETAL